MSIGAFPMYALMEFAYQLRILDEVFRHPAVKILMNLGAEFVQLEVDADDGELVGFLTQLGSMNDILSCQKEVVPHHGTPRLVPHVDDTRQGEHYPFNMVAMCRMNGMSAQRAFDGIASMVDARFIPWDKTLEALPSWGGIKLRLKWGAISRAFNRPSDSQLEVRESLMMQGIQRKHTC
ncbi:hypothetical protein F4780DRAFT_754153 [Xylariomycetidae sp. FL0641]|nr:hypothetical protein F4780DRAFT_754153 [Xylariomycetidae sp. FL0641]